MSFSHKTTFSSNDVGRVCKEGKWNKDDNNRRCSCMYTNWGGVEASLGKWCGNWKHSRFYDQMV